MYLKVSESNVDYKLSYKITPFGYLCLGQATTRDGLALGVSEIILYIYTTEQ